MVLVWEPIGAVEELKLGKQRIGLIFDGETEKKAIPSRLCQKTCKFHPLKRKINGNAATLRGISRECIKFLSALNRRGVKLSFVIVDREDKQESASEMGQKLTNLIADEYSGHFVVVVADMMFENWLVADIEQIKMKYSDLIRSEVKNFNRDGKHGEAIIKKAMHPDRFKKTVHGPKFFKAIRINEAIKNSPSFDYFIGQLKSNGVVIH